jgi:preprotein translocase subunit SecF
MRLPIIKLRNLWFLISGALVVASLVSLIVYPLKFGIDFTGGSLLEVTFEGQRPEATELTEAMAAFGHGESLVQTVGDQGMLVRTKTMDEDGHKKLLADLADKYGVVIEQRFESIGPTVGGELRRKALWSLGLVLAAIALYVAYAFRKVSRPVASWKFGVTTLVVAVLHDVLMPLGLFSLLGHYYGVEINSGLVAAFLTVLGYSVHDTIVVFDRIRENLLKVGGKFEEIVERSVNETMARSFNTSFTAFLPLLAISLWGGPSLTYFALALMVGLVSGTYSSIFLASPMLVVWEKKSSR